jgi:hypothetical protein
MGNTCVEYLKRFSEENHQDTTLRSKYDKNELLNALKIVIGHEVCLFIKSEDKNVSYTDMQTDIKNFFNFFK